MLYLDKFCIVQPQMATLKLPQPSLKDRVFLSGVEDPPPSRDVSSYKYKQWDNMSMNYAMKAVMEEGLSIRRAAERYSIPKSTLGDRISGRVLPGSISGPPKLLTEHEEAELEKFIFHCAAIGYGKPEKTLLV